MGGTPLFALALVGMPIKVLSNKTIARILEGGAEACRSAGIPIAGGHTIDSVEPIYGLVAIGLVDPKNVKSNASAQAGDVLILGKPLGVGILSAALKKDLLGPDGYKEMIANTTKLNSAGPELAKLSGVHALTDVTGFGLAGHTLELAKGSGCTAHIDWSQVPLLSNVQALADDGVITGASDRNWASYGNQVGLPHHFSTAQRALLTDPQTSGGLLVSCSPESVQAVLNIFGQHQFLGARVIGQMSKLQDKHLVISA
jgi:selenide,water dikinase